MKRILTILFLFCLFVSGTAQVLTLRSVLDSIEKNNPLLLSYENKINASNALVSSASAWNAPRAGVELDQNPYSFDNFYNGAVRLSLTQDFPNRKMINAESNYLRSLSQIDLNEYRYERNKAFSEAKSSYYRIYIMQKDTAILHQNIEILNSMIELSEKRMGTGKGDMASIFILQAKVAEAQAKLIHDENMIKIYMVNINYLMNRDVDQTFSIDTSSVVKNYRSLYVTGIKDSLQFRRSDIMQMNSMIYSLQLNQSMTRLRTRPMFGFKLEHFIFMDRPDMFSIMGMMTIPIAPWSSGRFKSQVRSTEYRIAGMQQEKQNMVNMTYQRIRMLSIEMQSEYRELDVYAQKVIPAYRKSFDATMIGFGQNTSELPMVLIAFGDLQMAQMEYLKHLEALLEVQVNYEREMQIQ